MTKKRKSKHKSKEEINALRSGTKGGKKLHGPNRPST